MAISSSRLTELQAQRGIGRSGRPRAVFTGSMYEPRATILNEIQEHLRSQGLGFDLLVRDLHGERVPNSEYWGRLLRSDILVTTAVQAAQAGREDVGLPHLIFRYSEALVAGALLVAPEVPGIRRYLLPEVHFVSYSTPAEAADRIAYYLTHSAERQAIASSGANRMAELIRSHAYWVAIDSALGKQSMT